MSSIEMEEFESSQIYIGFWTRFGALFIDNILIAVIVMATLYQLYGSSYWPSGGPNTEIAGSVIQGIFLFLSTILFWIYKSATPGKMLFKVKIVDAKTGNAPTVKQAVIRYIGYYISILPMGLGLLWICWDKKKQGWHDKLAGTVVIGPANRGIENGSFSENNT